jgi:hypothetical protein
MTGRLLALSHRPGVLLSVLNLGLGVVLLLGDPLRTSSASFATARQLLPIPLWGVLFLAGGLVCAAAANWGCWGALAVALGGAGVHAFWAAALTESAAADKRAALTGCVAYSWFALAHVVTGVRLARRVA